MRIISTLSLVSLIFFFGCDQNSKITSPVDEIKSENANWIALPSPEGLSVNSQSFTYSKRIIGNKGGIVPLNRRYNGGPFGVVIIKSKLILPENAFTGTEEITITCFPEEGTVRFGPSMLFDKDLQFTVEYLGVDLTGVDPNQLEFCYIAANGSLEVAENSSIELDFENGKIKVTDAKIPHFSRYGFVNRQM